MLTVLPSSGIFRPMSGGSGIRVCKEGSPVITKWVEGQTKGPEHFEDDPDKSINVRAGHLLPRGFQKLKRSGKPKRKVVVVKRWRLKKRLAIFLTVFYVILTSATSSLHGVLILLSAVISLVNQEVAQWIFTQQLLLYIYMIYLRQLRGHEF